MNQYLVTEGSQFCCLLITFLLTQRLDVYGIDFWYVVFRFGGYRPNCVDQ